MSPRRPLPDSELVERREILDEAGFARALRRMAYELVERVGQQGDPIYLVGLRTGGVYLAARIAELISASGDVAKPTVGAADISLYRDDVFHGLPKPQIGPTDLPEPIDERVVVLVDDVLFTGRTIRAAMDVLGDYGRPRAVKLAVLVDRGGRELPIQPDVVGVTVQTAGTESVKVMFKERGESDRVVLRERRA
jgi:pyrimidine operon attenuation protein/uracil phosphoribosyltransferase